MKEFIKMTSMNIRDYYCDTYANHITVLSKLLYDKYLNF